MNGFALLPLYEFGFIYRGKNVLHHPFTRTKSIDSILDSGIMVLVRVLFTRRDHIGRNFAGEYFKGNVRWVIKYVHQRVAVVVARLSWEHTQK